MARRKHGTLIGHAPITTQLDWCEEAEVRHAIFAHRGSPIVRGNVAKIDAIVRHLGIERGIDAQVAVDGLRLFLGDRTTARGWAPPNKSASRNPRGWVRTRVVVGWSNREVDKGIRRAR
jgi:hypothetical protein